MEWLVMERWSPWVVGAAIGLLSCLAFLLSDRPLGCSTTFTRTAGMIEKWIRGARAVEKPYYRMFPPEIDWQVTLVAGIVLGAFASSMLSGAFEIRWVPDAWAQTAGPAPAFRWIVALAGGVLMGLGARWARGCTSGHGISGTLQLAVSGWIAAACFFIGGIAAATLLFRVILA